MLPTKLFNDGKNLLQWLQLIISYDEMVLKCIVKLCVPTWFIFAGPAIDIHTYMYLTVKTLAVKKFSK